MFPYFKAINPNPKITIPAANKIYVYSIFPVTGGPGTAEGVAVFTEAEGESVGLGVADGVGLGDGVAIAVPPTPALADGLEDSFILADGDGAANFGLTVGTGTAALTDAPGVGLMAIARARLEGAAEVDASGDAKIGRAHV